MRSAGIVAAALLAASWVGCSGAGPATGDAQPAQRTAPSGAPAAPATGATGAAAPEAPAAPAAEAPEPPDDGPDEAPGEAPSEDTAASAEAPTDAAVPPGTGADAGVAPAPAPSWEVELARPTPFGCTVRAVERDVVLRGPERNAAFRAWAERARRFALLPAPLAATLPRPGVVYLVTSAGLCLATVGSPVLGGGGDRPILGSRISGCARGAPFALVCEAGTRLPRGPRWTSLGAVRPRRLGATGSAGDPLADRSFRAFGVLLPQASRRAFRTSRDRGPSLRRVSVRSLDLPSDSLRVVDLGWAFFDEDADPRSGCPRADLLASALYLRSGDAPAADAGAGAAEAWRRGGAFRGAIGVIHDGARLLAVASSGIATGAACWGAESCREIVLHPRTAALRLERGPRAPYGFSSGELLERSPLSLGRARDCAP